MNYTQIRTLIPVSPYTSIVIYHFLISILSQFQILNVKLEKRGLEATSVDYWLKINHMLYVYIQPFHRNRMRHKVNFYAEFNGVEFRIFLRLHWLSYQCKRAQFSLQLSIHEENIWVYKFSKSIGSMWDAITIIQDLNLGLPVWFSTKIIITPDQHP